MTLLEHYIKFSTREFQEPDRKGIEKGNAIGFYRGSHNAALFSLYNYEQKEIARLAGISYDFYRKQRTNKNFNGLAETLKEEFVEIYLYGYLVEGAFYKIDNSTFSSLEEFDKTEMSPEVAFADIANYSTALKKYIVKQVSYLIGHLGIHDILDGADRLLYMMSHWNEPELNKEIFKTVVKYGEEFICNTINSEDSTEEMRAIATNCTHFIAKLVSTL